MLQITDAEVKKRLAFDNPWWDHGAVAAQIRAWKKRAYLEGFHKLLTERGVNRAVVLMGPRRVGKTVMLHQAIQRLIEDGQAPGTILYVSVDTPVYTGWSLERLLDQFMQVHGHDRHALLYVIFDEVQYLRDWERHLKSLVDSYPSMRFVASGSAAAALRLKSTESGAGRFTDYMLPCLGFSEFLDFLEVEPPNLEGNETERAEVTRQFNDHFVDYLNFGGFPEAVLQDSVRSAMDRFVASDILEKVLLRDLPSLYGVDNTLDLNRLFTTIAYTTGDEVSLDGLASASGIAKNTLRKYLTYLEAAFLIVRLPRIDQTARRLKRESHFKVYLTNPCLRAALFGAVTADDEAMGRMAETAVVSQIAQSPKQPLARYARWKEGEVDLVYVDFTGKPIHATEIKWSDRPVERPEELQALIAFARKHGLKEVGCTTRTADGKRDFGNLLVRFFPTSVLCAAISLATKLGVERGANPFKTAETFADLMQRITRPAAGGAGAGGGRSA